MRKERTAEGFSDAEAVATFINSKLDAEALRRLPRLELVASRSTGYDHIDLDHCRAHGITVCNVPGYGDHTVAEHAFALLLAVARNIVDSVERTRRALVANHVLLRFPNVIVTPHNAYHTDSAVRRIVETTLDNIDAYARGAPQNVVGER